MPATEVYVTRLPKCDHHPDEEAKYDCATVYGYWMYACERCYRDIGRGLGLGKGQRLILRPPADS